MAIVMEEEEEDKSTLRLLYFTSSPTFSRVSGFVDMRSHVSITLLHQVLVSSVVIHFEPSWKLADPLCTLVFGIFALLSTIPTIWNLLKTLLEATPENLSYDEVHETLSKVRGVIGVHSLHLWSLSAPVVCLTVHLTIKLGDDIEGVRTRAAAMVRAKHKINKITIQVETQQQAVEADCLECQPLL